METAPPIDLASAETLTGSSADGSTVALPANCTALALELSYTRHGSSGSGAPIVGLSVDCGAGMRKVCSFTGSAPPFTLAPWTVQPASAASIAHVVEVPLPPGAQRVLASYYDADGTHPGTLTLRATPRVGG